jgi:hypothetical protein
MKKLLIIIIALSIWSCKSSNDSFDPFDKDFKFHNSMNIAEYDTIWDSCGYWCFARDNKKGLTTYYGFFDIDVIAKGFSLEIDSLETNECDSLFYNRDNNVIENLFIKHPLNAAEIKARLSDLNINEVKILSPFEAEIINSENKILKASLHGNCNWNGKIIRSLDYSNAIDDSQRKDVNPVSL